MDFQSELLCGVMGQACCKLRELQELQGKVVSLRQTSILPRQHPPNTLLIKAGFMPERKNEDMQCIDGCMCIFNTLRVVIVKSRWDPFILPIPCVLHCFGVVCKGR